MNLILIFSFLILDKITYFISARKAEATLGINDRVALLKYQISDQIKKNLHSIGNVPEKDEAIVNEDLEYENHELDPITPIDEKDPRKKERRFRLNAIKTTRQIHQKFKSNDDFLHSPLKKSLKSINPGRKRSKMIKKSKISDVFYRRSFMKNIVSDWTHCQDLITPFLTGHKTNMTSAKRIAYDNSVVIRLIQLLTEDITDHTKDDINSILYQISNLQLRLFQWDVAAIKLLLNVINRDKIKKHSFKTIKHGLKEIFKIWNLSIGANPTALLKQTRVFRPPCIEITGLEGSTKTSKSIRYSKPAPPKRCLAGDGDYDCDDGI